MINIGKINFINNEKVRDLREELYQLLEPGSYVAEVIKPMGKTKVLVKVCFSFYHKFANNFNSVFSFKTINELSISTSPLKFYHFQKPILQNTRDNK